ncbi:hypothetical protein VTH06DRAFT_4154 [Thermothelomyces fergusii]
MKLSLLLFASSLAAASPVTSLDKRQQATLCEQYGYWSGYGYEVNNNNWGRNSASGGWQCTWVDSSSYGGVAWHTTWNWQGGENSVKSFANCGLQVPKGRTIASINNLQTSISWSYSNTNIRANVAYDLFTAADPNHATSSGDYELMIWLARYGNVYPIGSSQGWVNVAGQDWELWVGWNGNMRVYSFVAPSPRNYFSANVKDFFNYLQWNQGFPANNQHLLIFQAGTEPFTGGDATFTVHNYYASVA